jgi:hypothetical protein
MTGQENGKLLIQETDIMTHSNKAKYILTLSLRETLFVVFAQL